MKRTTNNFNTWYYMQNTRAKFERYLTRVRQMQKDGSFYQMLVEQQKQMLRRLDILYRRLKELGKRFGLKLAGATLALLLSTGVYAEAQYFNEKTGDENPLNEFQDSQSATLSFVDIDGDGDQDFFAMGEENHFYRNTGNAGSPVFEEEPYSDVIYLPEGYDGSVTFVDIDDDGDFDAIISKNNSTDNPEPIFLRNQGTASEPDFVWEQDSEIEFPGGNNMQFVDIDGDEDYDLFLMDDSSGKYDYVQFYKNTGDANNPIFTKQSNENNPLYNKLYSNAHAFLQFFDFDKDHDYDVLQNHYMNTESTYYLMNTGNPVAPQFKRINDPDNPFYSLPSNMAYFYIVDIDNDTDMDIFISPIADGKIRYFANEDSYDSDISLIKPADGSEDVTLMPTLEWNYSCVSDKFQLELSNDPDFNSIYDYIGGFDLNRKNISVDTYLNPETTYYWRVRIGFKDEWSEWSDTWSFTTGSNDFDLSLVSPPDGSTDVFLSPTFEWDYTCLTDQCFIEIADDTEFENVVFKFSTPDKNVKSWTYYHILEPNKTFYWRVKIGLNDMESEWSDTWSFTTISGENLLEMISPVNNATQVPLAPKFQWNMDVPINDTTGTYHIRVSEYPGFDYCDIDVENSYDETYQPQNPLKGNMEYYWKVKVDFGSYTTGWSDVWKFKTESKIEFETDYVLQGGQNNPFYDLDFLEYPFMSFVDIDNDGKDDCFVANSRGDIVFCQNAGTLNKPVFVPRTMYFNDLDYTGRTHIDFCDIDDDGDHDAIITGYGSKQAGDTVLCLHENIGTKEKAEFEFVDPENMNFEMPRGLDPLFIDIDNDGDYDLFLKHLTTSGKYKYFYLTLFENTGSKINPIFELGSYIGSNNPSIRPVDFDLVDIDGDEDHDLLCTFSTNEESLYLNGGSKFDYSFSLYEKYHSPLYSIETTKRSIKFNDIDKDGDFDLFVGNPDGTINFFKNEFMTSGVNENNNEIKYGAAFPNPFSAGVSINYELEDAAHVQVQIYDMTGNLIDTLLDEYQNSGSQTIHWEPEELPPGVYHCIVKVGDIINSIKIIRIK